MCSSLSDLLHLSPRDPQPELGRLTKLYSVATSESVTSRQSLCNLHTVVISKSLALPIVALHVSLLHRHKFIFFSLLEASRALDMQALSLSALVSSIASSL